MYNMPTMTAIVGGRKVIGLSISLALQPFMYILPHRGNDLVTSVISLSNYVACT